MRLKYFFYKYVENACLNIYFFKSIRTINFDLLDDFNENVKKNMFVLL